MLEPGHTEPTARQLANEPAAVRRLVRKLQARAPVARLRCFRGIGTITAVALVAELHDIRRFASAPQLMA